MAVVGTEFLSPYPSPIPMPIPMPMEILIATADLLYAKLHKFADLSLTFR